MPTIQKQKISTGDGACRNAFSWQVSRLGSDQHGLWVGSHRGTAVTQPDGRTEHQPHDAVWLIAEGAWWIPAFWFTDETDLTIDVCAPICKVGDGWTFVDLELDLFRATDGRAGIVDWEELDALAVSGHLSDDHVQQAIKTAESLLPPVEQHLDPFGARGRSWLEVLRKQDP